MRSRAEQQPRLFEGNLPLSLFEGLQKGQVSEKWEMKHDETSKCRNRLDFQSVSSVKLLKHLTSHSPSTTESSYSTGDDKDPNSTRTSSGSSNSFRRASHSCFQGPPPDASVKQLAINLLTPGIRQMSIIFQDESIHFPQTKTVQII